MRKQNLYNIYCNIIKALKIGFWFYLMLLTSACSSAFTPDMDDGKLNVVATTSLIGDAAEMVGGEYINLTILIKPGVDPHVYEPTPQDMAAVANADVLLINGFDLESFLPNLFDNLSEKTQMVSVSEGISPRELEEGGIMIQDPHVWFDPDHVAVWVENIAQVFAAVDEANEQLYLANAKAYWAELNHLDQWIWQQVEMIPIEKRALVTDHDVFGYFAAKYGFELIGVVIPGYTTAAQPSAQNLSALIDTVNAYQVPAVFVGEVLNDRLVQQIAEDTGVEIIYLFTGSLGEQESEAATYIKFMQYNVNQIVDSLAGSP